MNHYEVKITGRALSDMAAIYDYIADQFHAPDTAMKQYDRIADAIASLDTFPNRCKPFESSPERELGMRQLMIDNYSAIYVVEGDRVVVQRVLYSASDIVARLRDTEPNP